LVVKTIIIGTGEMSRDCIHTIKTTALFRQC
jgi:hypothetical protein